MVKEALSRIIHPIRRHGGRLLWVSRNNSGDPKLSAINNKLELPNQSVLRNSAQALLIAVAVTLLSNCATVEKTTNNEKEEKHTPIFLNPPVLSPSGTAPGKTARVAVGTTVKGSSSPPPVIYLDEVTSQGEFLTIQAELRDDGKKPDKEAGDRFYSTPRFELGSANETERYFRFRVEHEGQTVISKISVFAVTKLTLGIRPSNTDLLIVSGDGRGKLYSNEVVVGTHAGVSPRRVQEIVVKIGEKLGLIPDDNKIVGYLPLSDVYLVEFRKGKGTLKEVNRVISEFQAAVYRSDIRSTSPNFESKSAAAPPPQWFHGHMGVEKLWPRSSDPLPPSQLPLVGSPSIGVAVAEQLGVNCSDPDLAGKCADSSSIINTIPSCNYTIIEDEKLLDPINDPNTLDPNDGHGTKVGTLIAGHEATNSSEFDGVRDGVAWNTRLYPLLVNSAKTFESAVTCITEFNSASGGGDEIRILNFSQTITSSTITLRNAVCKAICSDIVIVAATGNEACDGPNNRYPAAYDSDSTPCNNLDDNACPNLDGPLIGAGVLRVGATDQNKARGSSCLNDSPSSAFNKRSNPGEIYAPGWELPVLTSSLSDTPYPQNYGTSWSTALVSGCAAILAAVQDWRKPDSWNKVVNTDGSISWGLAANKISSSVSADSVTNTPLLDCLAAISNPYDIAFVLDRSNSMNAVTSASKTRWQALTDAVDGITPMISATAPPGSQFGLTLFATTVLADPLTPPGLIEIPDDYNPDNTLNLNNLHKKVRDALDGMNPGGWTAMGPGLDNALVKLGTDSGRPRVVVLFTDGMQNQPPLVNPDGCTYSNSTDIHSNSTPTSCPADTGLVRIVAVGINSPNSIYFTTLQALANNSGGSFFIIDGTTFSDGLVGCTNSLDNAFDCAIAPALYGNSPQMVAAFQGTLAGNVNLPPFHLNQVSQLLIKISFSQKLGEQELSTILNGLHIKKGPENITRYFKRVSAGFPTHSVLLKTDFVHQKGGKTSTIPPEGSYRIIMSAKDNPSPALTYRVVVYADDHRLNMKWRVNPQAPSVHQPFSPTVNLSWRAKPLTHATVKAYILQPGDDLGDVLAKNPARVDPVPAPDAGSPGYQKYLHLKAKDPDFRGKLRHREKLLPLKHQGNGKYSASYNPGDISGVYQVVYKVHAVLPGIGTVQRTAGQSVYVGPGEIDFENSSAKATAQGNTVTIKLRPKRKDGKFIGPAQGNGFRVEGVKVRLTKIEEDQMGGYTLFLDGKPDSKIVIKFLGKPIYKGIAKIPPDNRNIFQRFFDWLKGLCSSC